MLQQNAKLDLLSLFRPIKSPKIWFHLSYINTINEYRRTLLGPLWILLSLVIFTLAVGAVYSGLFSVAYFDYITFMAGGMIAWNWAAAILLSSGMVYLTSAGIIMDQPVDKAYLIWSHAMSNFIVFLHQIPLFLLFYLVGKAPLNSNFLYIIPSLLIIFLMNIGVAAIFGVLVSRYRDLNKILGSLVIIIMIVTPIFWKPEMVTGVRALVYYMNPFYYIVEIIRDPLMGENPGAFNYLVSSLIAIASLAIGAVVHKRYSKYVVFWL